MSIEANLVPVTRERHQAFRWYRFRNYEFARHLSVVPIVGPELARVALSMPCAFALERDSYVPVALVGVEQNFNLFVGADSRWLVGYVPAILRVHPFSLRPTGDGEQVLCVDETYCSAVGIFDESEVSESFFADDGRLTPVLSGILEFLSQLEVSRRATIQATQAVAEHQLLQAWPISISLPSGQRKIEGAFRIDEVALNSLSADALMDLRDRGGLVLAYTQLLSMQNIETLVELAKVHEKALRSATEHTSNVSDLKGDLDLSFLSGDTLKF